MLLLSNQTLRPSRFYVCFSYLCSVKCVQLFQVVDNPVQCGVIKKMWIYWEPSVLHTKPTGLQISQRKHLFNKCEPLAVVLSPCHCVLVSILLASNSHKWENLLQLARQIQWIFSSGGTNTNVLECVSRFVKGSVTLKGSQVKQHWWSL